MRKLKDALRLKLESGQSHQQIADALAISKGVVTKYVGLAVAAALDWPAVQAMDEATLERRLFSAARQMPTYTQSKRATPAPVTFSGMTGHYAGIAGHVRPECPPFRPKAASRQRLGEATSSPNIAFAAGPIPRH